MIRKKRRNSLNWGRFVAQTQKRFKKKYGKRISSKDIKNIWDSWLEEAVILPVLRGEAVKMDANSTIEIIGEPIKRDSVFYKLLMHGKMVRRDGVIVKTKQDALRKDVKYKIVYTNTMAGDKAVQFKADPKFSARVRQSLNSTNTYYKINYVNK